MKAARFEYAKAQSLDQVFELLAAHGDDARILAGGQSLLATLNMRLSQPSLLIDINGLSQLSGITVSGDTIRIGALTRHRVVERSPEIAQHLPLIAKAMPHIAHAAIRNRGTFGGSIALADPAAELPACALALGATFIIAGQSGERRVAADDFFHGLFETAIGPGEVLVGAEFPIAKPGDRAGFSELARRHGDYAMVGLAAQSTVSGGQFTQLKLSYFGVDIRPVLATAAAAELVGVPFDDAAVERAKAVLADELDPSDDLNASGATKKHLAGVLLQRVTRELIQDA